MDHWISREEAEKLKKDTFAMKPVEIGFMINPTKTITGIFLNGDPSPEPEPEPEPYMPLADSKDCKKLCPNCDAILDYFIYKCPKCGYDWDDEETTPCRQ